jgi:hypothetical protein
MALMMPVAGSVHLEYWYVVYEIAVSPLFSLLRKESLGEPHALLAGGERYFSHRFAVEAERVVQQELAAAGLGDRRDYLEFVELVKVVQRATVEFYGWVTGVDGDYGVLVASLGRRAVCLVRRGECVRFARCDADRMVETLVGRLPEVTAAGGSSISVGHAEFHSVPRGLMRRSTTRSEGARRLDALLDSRRSHVAKLYAAKRDDDGNRRRSEQWVSVLDLADGRWVLGVTQARHQKWISAGPGTPRVIAGRLGALARSIR